MLLLVTIFVMTLVHAGAASKCENKPNPIKSTKTNGCEIQTISGKVQSAGGFVEYIADSLICDGKTIVDNAAIVQGAMETCSWGLEGGVEYNMEDRLKVVSTYKQLISVAQDSGGFTGGAHSYAVATVHTYNKNTGARVGLRDIFGADKARQMITKGKAMFDKKNAEENCYKYAPEDFSISDAGNGNLTVTIASSHSVELCRGQTLDVTLTEKAPGSEFASNSAVSAKYHETKGLACIKKKDFYCASEHFRHAANFDPDNPQRYDDLAYVYQKQYDYDQCVTWGKKAEAKAAGNNKILGSARYNVASCYAKKGEKDNACAYYKKSLEARPDNAATLKACKALCGQCP